MNTSKSKVLFSQNYSAISKLNLSSILGIKTSNYFGKYLSFLTFHKKPTPGGFQFMLDNMNSKLAGWKSKYLNMAGKTTLHKTCLGSMPNHVRKYIPLPRKIHKLIDRFQRNFIRGSTDSRKRCIWSDGIPSLNPKKMEG